jgi:general stress protein CsbA
MSDTPSAETRKSRRVGLLTRITIVLLLAGAAVSFYEAFFVVDIPGSAQFILPLALFGGLKVFVAILCTRGRSRPFMTAAVVASIGTATDIILGGDHYLYIAAYIVPSVLTIVFSLITFRAMHGVVAPVVAPQVLGSAKTPKPI